MNHAHRRIGRSGAGIAVTFSLLAHAGVALVGVRHAPVASLSPLLASTASLVPTLDVVIAEVDTAPEPREKAVVAAPAPILPSELRAAHATVASAPGDTRAEPEAEPAPSSEPSAVSASPSFAGPHFALVVAPTTGKFGIAGNADAASVSAEAGHASQPIAASVADIPAKLQAGSVPAYTAAALSAGVEVSVPLEIVVSESGSVISARGTEHVGYGLDEAARQSVLGYRFSPALRAGKAIAVRMRWMMRFQLR